MRKISFVINVTKNGKEIHDPILSNPSYLIFIQKKENNSMTFRQKMQINEYS